MADSAEQAAADALRQNWAGANNSALLTDLYQLNMMQAYLDSGFTETAAFEFFVRKLPPRRGFLIAAGLTQFVDYLLDLRFSEDELRWLSATGRFSESMLAYLADLRFTGDVDAMPEGTVFFADEPILRVVAPLPIAQLVETRAINLLHFESLIAAKAARMVLAAPGKTLVDFGLRRAHGAEAGLLAARASYLAGFTGTATVPAAALYGIPIFGTMAHSFIQAHTDEAEAFENFARARPEGVVLLIDTYDTEAAAEKVVALAPKLKRDGIGIRGVRLDSGDLAEHARKVRRILDAGGLSDTIIFASGGIGERDLQAFVAADAPIDGYGLGTRLTTSADVPALDCAYKLEEYAGTPRRKKSEGKATWPGRKQVYRRVGADGRMVGDTIALESEAVDGAPLLAPVIRHGRLIAPLPTLDESRERAVENLAALPEPLRRLEEGGPYAVEISAGLRDLAAHMDAEGR